MKRLLAALLVCAGAIASTASRAQQPPSPIDRIVIAGGADVTGLNGLDVITIVPDRSLMDHISDTLLRWEAPGKLGPWLATSSSIRRRGN